MTVNPILYRYQTDKYPGIYNDYQELTSKFSPSGDENNIVFEALPIAGRINNFADKMSAREYTTAAGLGALAVLNGPEELGDIVSAYRQIKGKYQRPYNNKIAQHPFSFFRGTILNDYLNPNSPKCLNKKAASWLIDKDTTLMQSGLGGLVSKIFNIKTRELPTSIPDIDYSEKFPKYVLAKQFITKSSLGEITARALTRTPKLGVAALGGIEAAHIAHETSKGGNFWQEAGKSALNLTATLAATGYGGAIGAKYAGPAGSLIGMGLGAITGYKVSQLIS